MKGKQYKLKFELKNIRLKSKYLEEKESKVTYQYFAKINRKKYLHFICIIEMLINPTSRFYKLK